MINKKKVLIVVLLICFIAAVAVMANAHLGLDISEDALMAWIMTHDVQYVTEDAVFHDMAQGISNEGRDAIKGALDYVYTIAFDSTPIINNVIIGEGKGVVEANIAGTHIGEFAGISATNRDIEFPILITYDLNEEWPYLIREARIYMMVGYIFDQVLEGASTDLVPKGDPFADFEPKASVAVTSDILTGWANTLDLKYVTDDVVFVDMSTGDLFATNRDELGVNLNWFYNIAFAGGIAEPNLIAGEGVGVLEFNLVGTHTGEFAGIAATGLEVNVPKAVVYELEEEYPYRIKNARFYLMVNVLLEQLTAEQ